VTSWKQPFARLLRPTKSRTANFDIAKTYACLTKIWWRRGELNPRPKSATPRSLHAYLSSIGFAFRAKNEQETRPASPMVLARALRTERLRPAHCMTLLAGPVSKARGSVRLIN
jgi:hypothetical protein